MHQSFVESHSLQPNITLTASLTHHFPGSQSSTDNPTQHSQIRDIYGCAALWITLIDWKEFRLMQLFSINNTPVVAAQMTPSEVKLDLGA